MPQKGLVVDKKIIDRLKDKRTHKNFMEIQIESGVHQSTLSLLLKYPDNYKVGEQTIKKLESYLEI